MISSALDIQRWPKTATFLVWPDLEGQWLTWEGKTGCHWICLFLKNLFGLTAKLYLQQEWNGAGVATPPHARSRMGKWHVRARVNPAVAGVFRHPPFAGGVKRPQPITREPIGAAKRTRRQTKERDETLQMSTLKLNFEVTGRVKVRSNTWNRAFSSMDFRTSQWAPLVINSVQTVHNPSYKA